MYAKEKMEKNMKEKIGYIEAIRGIACLIVLFAHIVSIHPQYGVYASGCGKIGVWCFMLLSGMLLFAPYVECEDRVFSCKELLLYYRNKILRIYPAYLCAICIAYLMGLLSAMDIPKHILCVKAWGHFWYMPVIIKFYCIAPIFLIVYSELKKYIPRYANVIEIFLLIVVCMFFIFAFPHSDYIENSVAIYWYMPVFIIGMLLTFVISMTKLRVSSTKIMEVLVIIGIMCIIIPTPLFRKLIWGIDPSNYLQNKYVYMAMCWFVILFAISHSRIAKNILERAVFLKKVGAISYEIYLIHYLILNIAVQQCSSFVLTGILVVVISLMLAIFMRFVGIKVKKWIIIKQQLILIFIIVVVLVMLPYMLGTNFRTKILKLGKSDNGIEKSVEHDVWEERLYVPTMINKVGDTYFIVDCWHHRVLYSEQLEKNIENWNVLTDDSYVGGHTICSDGELIVLDNTDGSSILVYKNTETLFSEKKYQLIQTIDNITGRPHYVTYDSENECFYVIASIEGTIHVLKNNGGYLELLRSDNLNEISNSYVRSISIIDGCLYTVSGPNYIYKYRISQDGFELEESYSVPGELSGMNQITKIEDYYYITVNTGVTGSVDETTIIRTKNLASLYNKEYENLYDTFGFIGQPYFITYVDDEYYITEISENHGNGIKKFSVQNNEIVNIESIYYYDDVTQSSKQRYQKKYDNLEGKEKVDLFLFAGQSNMSGKGNKEEAPVVLRGYEFRAVSDPTTLYPIAEPFGIMENREDGINDTWEGMTILRKTGGMVSAFANAYYSYTGKAVVGVSCSEGATTISQWMPGTKKYEDLLERSQLAKKYLMQSEQYSLQKTYLLWCQGESDGDIGTTYDDYYQSLSLLMNSLVEQNVIDHSFVVAIGNNGNDPNLYNTIHSAQVKLCQDSEVCTLVSDSFRGMQEKGLMIDDYHYCQEGYNIVGEEAGKNVAVYLFNGIN